MEAEDGDAAGGRVGGGSGVGGGGGGGGGSGGGGASAAAAAAPSQFSSTGTTTADFLPWVEKYRPSRLDELVSQKEVVTTISRLIDANRLPHLLFYGPPGTGKTTTILALARKLYGPAFQSMVLELNASDDRGIDVVREQIKSFAGTRKLFSTGVKLIILDEADAMTNDAQFALRRVIEKFTRNTRFCLICNYVSKIIPALQSRCTRFRFAPLAIEDMSARLRFVVDKEGLSGRVAPDGLAAILRLAGGDMRKVLNVLQATASGFERVDADAVHACTGNPTEREVRDLLHALLNRGIMEAHEALRALLARGFALSDVLNELARVVPEIEMPPEALRLLMERMAEVEHRIAFGTSEKLQGASLVAAFALAKEALGNASGR